MIAQRGLAKTPGYCTKNHTFTVLRALWPGRLCLYECSLYRVFTLTRSLLYRLLLLSLLSLWLLRLRVHVCVYVYVLSLLDTQRSRLRYILYMRSFTTLLVAGLLGFIWYIGWLLMHWVCINITMNHSQAVQQLQQAQASLSARASNTGSRLPINPVAELARTVTQQKK